MITTNETKHDVVIVGGGPAGAATALYLLQSGVRPVILEKESFPRYHIGESLTGEVGKSLRELGLEQQLSSAAYPIKHGVTVYGPDGNSTFWVPVMKRDEQGQLQPATTWQVRRSDFDQMLLDAAVERGAVQVPYRAEAPLMENDRVVGVRARNEEGQSEELQARVVVDASGQSTFLANSAAPTTAKERGRYDKQVAVFTQVSGAIRDPGDAAGNTLIFYREKNHWAWFIPLAEDVVSVGVVVPGELYSSHDFAKADFLRDQLKTLNPELARRLENAQFVEDVHTASNYSYHVKQFTGKGFLCVGDAHRFVDPIFSFGVNFAVKEARFASESIVAYLEGATADQENPFAEYQRRAERAQDIIQDLVDVFWDHPLPFVVLVHHDRHREGMIDLFAGRIFEEDVLKSQALLALRECKLKAKAVVG